MADISKITLPDDTTYNIKDNNARNFTNTPYYEQDEEALMFQLGESYMTGEQDNQPYSFRAAGGSADIGNREYDKIVGGTVAWNQLARNSNWSSNFFPTGSTTTYNSTSNTTTYTATMPASGYGYICNSNFSSVQDHIYLVLYSLEQTGTVSFWGKIDGTATTSSSTNIGGKRYGYISKATKTSTFGTAKALIGFSAPQGTEISAVISKGNIIDLTQMFGTTIADYIYSLETATHGAGVAWFRKLFPKPYYEYNAGELMSVQAVAHKLVGFNAWDEEWQLGIINTTTGEETDSSSNIRSKNYIRVIPGATYYFKLGTTDISNNIVFYDAEKNYVAASDEHVNDVFTVPENAHYMKFYMSTNYGSVYLSNICINLSGDGERDGQYEEYNMHSYPLDSSLVLRGIPKLDANHQLYYDGDEYQADGTVTRKYKQILLDDSLAWHKDGDNNNYNRYYFEDDSIKRYTNYIGLLVNSKGYSTASKHMFDIDYGDIAVSLYSASRNTNKGKNWFYVAFKTSLGIDTLASFKDWIAANKFSVVVELAEPTTETAEPYDNPQIIDPEGTEEYITTNIVFVGHETKY